MSKEEAQARHKALMDCSFLVSGIPTKVILEALKDHGVIDKLMEDIKANPQGMMKLMDMIAWASKNMPNCEEMQRLAQEMIEKTDGGE